MRAIDDEDDEVLRQLAARGQRLARDAGMVGDQADFHVWRGRRNAWVEDAGGVLENEAPAVAESFRRALRLEHPRSDWRHALPDELERVAAAVTVLLAGAEPAGDGAP